MMNWPMLRVMSNLFRESNPWVTFLSDCHEVSEDCFVPRNCPRKLLTMTWRCSIISNNYHGLIFCPLKAAIILFLKSFLNERTIIVYFILCTLIHNYLNLATH